MSTTSADDRRPDGVVKALVQPEDARVPEVRDILLGASTMGFVNVIVIGVRPRNEGITVIGSSDLDALRAVGALEVAKQDVIRQMRVGPRTVPPGAKVP